MAVLWGILWLASCAGSPAPEAQAPLPAPKVDEPAEVVTLEARERRVVVHAGSAWEVFTRDGTRVASGATRDELLAYDPELARAIAPGALGELPTDASLELRSPGLPAR